MSTSEVSGFYKLNPKERLDFVRKFAGLDVNEVALLAQTGALNFDTADRMIENVVGVIGVPLGIAVNFRVNERDYLIPMAIEEPSVVAAASNAARMARLRGGFWSSSTDPIMIGQIQVVGVRDPHGARTSLLRAKQEIIARANEQDPVLVSMGGGARDLDVKVISTLVGPMVIAELLVDCRDAMGANAVNTMAEACAPLVERITRGRVYLRIISNLAVKRLARSRAVFGSEAIGDEEVVDAVIAACAFAAADPFRCATHNKGIMNGITAMTLATGNDTRAVEAGAHAYAARSGHYSPLTTWEKDQNGDLVGTIELPLAVGTVGGATKTNPLARVALKILGIKSATELAQVMAAVGLAQNFAALRALATEGIQRGHMTLHARNIAISAGAEGELVDIVAEKMVEERKIRVDRAKELIEAVRKR